MNSGNKFELVKSSMSKKMKKTDQRFNKIFIFQNIFFSSVFNELNRLKMDRERERWAARNLSHLHLNNQNQADFPTHTGVKMKYHEL